MSDARGGGRLGDRFDVSRMDELATVVAGRRSDHLLLPDGLRAIRLDGSRGLFAGGPVRLAYRLDGLAAAEPPLLALRRLLALCSTGRFLRSLHPREVRARRWILQLRAWDATAAGAGQREIAEVLLSRSAAEACWRTLEPSLRSQAQRLVRSARGLAAGGYRFLLG